jgi:hypothetical protein
MVTSVPLCRVTRQLGFVAQQVLPILPQAVQVGTDGEHMLALKYDALVAILVKAAQEQQKKLAEHQVAIDHLNAVISRQAEQLKSAAAERRRMANGLNGLATRFDVLERRLTLRVASE